MTTLTEFLEQRIAEDEAVARAATDGPWVEGVVRAGEPGRWRGVKSQCVLAERIPSYLAEPPEGVADMPKREDAAHIARHDPARELAECAARRAIVELADEATCLDLGVDADRRVRARDVAAEPYIGDLILRHLAAPYADHPDYDQAWSVS